MLARQLTHYVPLGLIEVHAASKLLELVSFREHCWHIIFIDFCASKMVA